VLRILIVDDHAIVREGLKRILGEYPDKVAIGEVGDGAGVLAKVRNGEWDLVLLDINLPHRDGLDVLKQIKREQPGLPVLVLSIYPEDQYALRVIKAGAAGYLTKESAPELLVEAIRRVAGGHSYISPALAEKLAGNLRNSGGRMLHENLSDRELEVFRLIASGGTVGRIAAQLSLSVHTVSTYRARILEKTGLKSNAELMRYAMDHNLFR
jgi:DNA-binding NarL/FixJ family response regulator